ncbi:transposase family protein [Streptomyces sp. 900116325]
MGPKQCLVFVDRLSVTLVHLRLGLPHAVRAELYGVDRYRVSAAIRQVRPLLAPRGFAVPDRPGLRLRTPEDVFAYADAEGVDLRTDETEVQARRPRADRPGRKAFVSDKKKQNTIKTTTFSDGQGRTLFSGVFRPGQMHDQTAVRTEHIAEQFCQPPDVRAEVDVGRRNPRAAYHHRPGIGVLGGVVDGARLGEQRTDLVSAPGRPRSDRRTGRGDRGPVPRSSGNQAYRTGPLLRTLVSPPICASSERGQRYQAPNLAGFEASPVSISRAHTRVAEMSP